MTTRASEPIVPTAVAAWRDALAACEKMPILVCAAGGVLFVLLFLNYLLYVLAVNYGLPAHVGFLAKIISAVARAFFLTPLAIAIHRFVLLGEITNVYRIDTGNPRFQKFFLFALALLALALAPAQILPTLERLAQWRVAIFVTWTIVTSTLVVFAVNRMIILFPAIAVDAVETDWRGAWKDTKGHSWSVLFTMSLIALTPSIVEVILSAPLHAGYGQGWAGGILLAVLQAAISAFEWAAMIAGASRLYAAYADRLDKPAGVSPRPSI